MILYIHKGKPLIKQAINDKVVGYVPVKHIELTEEPQIELTVEKIPFSLWRTALAFFARVNQEEKSEGQLRVFYSDEDKKWKFHAFPQKKGTGMTTKELPLHADFNKQMEEVLEGGKYYQWGTIHSHCDSSAFQSGVDKHDEEKNPGIHITMGKVNSKEIDVHCRFTVIIPGKIEGEWGKEVVTPAQTYFSPYNLLDLIEFPLDKVAPDAPPEILNFAKKFYLLQNSEEYADLAKVEEWMANRVEEANLTVYNPSGFSGGTYGELQDWYLSQNKKKEKGNGSVDNYWEWWDSKKGKKGGRKKKGKTSKFAYAKEHADLIVTEAYKTIHKMGVTSDKLLEVLEKFDHEMDEGEHKILAAIDTDILEPWGMNKRELAEMIEDQKLQLSLGGIAE